ncbi:hypothetical protein [Paraburkholderia saeva]|uniref:hypothetical protein n=1 Tax=Paraburkholderia saeva TaxID=2777537 RepID=UPI001E5C75B9|nr:hypothetical protein [Paraburkholderia saeva]
MIDYLSFGLAVVLAVPCTAKVKLPVSIARPEILPNIGGRFAMAIFWTLNNIPELRDLPARERRKVWRRAYHRTFNHWQTSVGLLAYALRGGLGNRFGAVVEHQFFGAMIGGGLGGFGFSQVVIYIARLHYRDVLLSVVK